MTTLEMDLGAVFPDRPMQSGLLYAPGDIEVDGEFLIWKRPLSGEASYRRPEPGMLAEFTRLAESPESVLAYARRWGVLGICKHELPCSHNHFANEQVRPCVPVFVPPPSDKSDFRFKDTIKDFRFKESIAVWHGFARSAKALLDIAAQLNQGKMARWEDWQMFYEIDEADYLDDPKDQPFMKNIQEARKTLASEVDEWITLGQVRPRIEWENKTRKWRFSLDAVSSGPNLFGLLALNLSLAIAGTELAVCCGCQKSYSPVRRPNSERRNYCDECRSRKVPERDAAREYRKRTRYHRGRRFKPG